MDNQLEYLKPNDNRIKSIDKSYLFWIDTYSNEVQKRTSMYIGKKLDLLTLLREYRLEPLCNDFLFMGFSFFQIDKGMVKRLEDLVEVRTKEQKELLTTLLFLQKLSINDITIEFKHKKFNKSTSINNIELIDSIIKTTYKKFIEYESQLIKSIYEESPPETTEEWDEYISLNAKDILSTSKKGRKIVHKNTASFIYNILNYLNTNTEFNERYGVSQRQQYKFIYEYLRHFKLIPDLAHKEDNIRLILQKYKEIH